MVILIDFVVQKDEKLLSTSFFKVVNLHWERKNVIRYITNDLEIFPLDSGNKILIKKIRKRMF